jgi:thiamine transport system permease protein
MTALPRGARAAVIAVPLAFLAVFFAYPVIAIVGRGLAPHWSVDLDPLGDVISDAALRHIAWFTVWQATLSTVFTLLVGLPGAYVLARCEFPGRTLVRALVTVPFVLPTVVVGSAFVALLGDGGPLAALGLDQTLGAILIAHVFFNYAVVVRTVGSLWSHLDPRQEEAARMLGASRLRTVREITLPALRPAIAAAGAVVFLFTFTSFGVILILGGPGTATLETEIYRQTAQFLNLPLAAALTVVQLVVIVLLLVLTSWIEGRQRVTLSLRAASETARRVRTRGARLFLGANLVLMALLVGVPLGVLLVRSFDTPSGLGLDFYRALGEVHAGSTLFVEPVHAIANSLRFAVAATLMAVVVGGCAAFALTTTRRRGLDTLISLPLGVSAVTVGFGFLITLDHPPVDLRGSWWLVPIAQALVAVPFVVRVMTPVLRSIDPRLRDAAATLGASPARVWREVDLPIVARAVTVAAGFAFAISLGEFGATVFIVRPDQPTLPVLVYRLLGQPGPLNFGGAMAASVILMALTTLAILGIERFRAGTVGSFS